MNMDEAVDRWRQSKSRGRSKRLDAPCSRQHEYRGRQFGHPSTYAFVRFDCVPADSFAFETRAAWPNSLSPNYCALLEAAMAAAIVDALLAGVEDPHTGCRLTCVEVKWDEVASSERAFYRATREAMISLRDEATWSWMETTKST
jgi:hypothetical protein